MSERVSFVIPAFNEALVIAGVVDDLHREVVDRLADAEVLIVDDCSVDGTAEVLRDLAARHPRVRLLRTDHNSGQGPATRLGFESAHGGWLCHVDGDGQLDPADFWHLWAQRLDADLVVGVRSARRDPRVRRVVSRSLRTGLTLMTGRRFADAAAPFRLVRAEVWSDVRPLVAERALTFSILVTVAAAARGWRVREVPISHLPRAHGDSSLHGARLLSFVGRAAFEVAELCLRLGARPGHRGRAEGAKATVPP